MVVSMPLMDTIARTVLGAVLSGGVALLARRAQSLTTSGAAAACITGTIATFAGWGWMILLVCYFVSSSWLSRHDKRIKAQMTSGIVEKSGARDATQVVANGGIFAAALLLASFGLSDSFARYMYIAALGALAASAADTWATEIGIRFGGVPRSLRTFRPVPRGTSGAASAPGCIAMVGGAVAVAMLAVALGLTSGGSAVAAAGIIGALVDTIAGAVVQERRFCAACNSNSEQRIHDCGAVTLLTGGQGWIDNDLVNLVATFVGAAVAAWLAWA